MVSRAITDSDFRREIVDGGPLPFLTADGRDSTVTFIEDADDAFAPDARTVLLPALIGDYLAVSHGELGMEQPTKAKRHSGKPLWRLSL